MPAKRGQIEIMRLPRIGMQGKRRFIRRKGNRWAELAGRTSLRNRTNDKSKKPERVPVEDDDYEDGDIATPKRDRHGNDDEPL